jgi:RNA polymerase sigma factor (sigma-70 family)
MAESSEADRYLMDQIARGDTDAWSQLVHRYHGRLLVFARSRMQRAADAEDLVQETFLRFLQSFRAFRPGASVETYLFTILRRRMIDHFRGRPIATCAIGDSSTPFDGTSAEPSAHSPSWYVRRDEQTELVEQAIAAGLDGTIRRLRDQKKLDEIRVIELIIYAQMRNKDIAKLCAIDEKQVAQIKFRALDQIREHLASNLTPRQTDALRQMRWEDADASDSVLTRVWESLRPTCPKRSTIGRLLLGTLDSPWREYVEFHLHQLGCRFCQANLEDLKRESESQPAPLRQQVFQSTVGFLTHASRPTV